MDPLTFLMPRTALSDLSDRFSCMVPLPASPASCRLRSKASSGKDLASACESQLLSLFKGLKGTTSGVAVLTRRGNGEP